LSASAALLGLISVKKIQTHTKEHNGGDDKKAGLFAKNNDSVAANSKIIMSGFLKRAKNAKTALLR